MSELKARDLKKKAESLLAGVEWKREIKALIKIYQGKLITPLFGSLYNSNPIIKWHAVSAFGYLAEELLEKERNKVIEIIRRCIWTLTEESGGIAWGSPEVMAEIMTKDRKIAEQFHDILIAYIFDNDEGTEIFLDHPPLRRGVYWGIARLAEIFPDLVMIESRYISDRCLIEEDVESIAHIFRTYKVLGLDPSIEFIKKYKGSITLIDLYENEKYNKQPLNSFVEAAVQ